MIAFLAIPLGHESGGYWNASAEASPCWDSGGMEVVARRTDLGETHDAVIVARNFAADNWVGGILVEMVGTVEKLLVTDSVLQA